MSKKYVLLAITIAVVALLAITYPIVAQPPAYRYVVGGEVINEETPLIANYVLIGAIVVASILVGIVVSKKLTKTG